MQHSGKEFSSFPRSFCFIFSTFLLSHNRRRGTDKGGYEKGEGEKRVKGRKGREGETLSIERTNASFSPSPLLFLPENVPFFSLFFLHLLFLSLRLSGVERERKSRLSVLSPLLSSLRLVKEECYRR